jgi:hypothetical protein
VGAIECILIDMNKRKWLRLLRRTNVNVPVVAIVLSCAVVGLMYTLQSFAQTAVVANEAEGGVIGGSAMAVSSDQASAGKSVVFGTSNNTASASFITRQNNQLMLDGASFRFAGANIYWLGLDDNIRDSSGQPTYPSTSMVDNGLSAASNMGMTVVRAHSLGISLGCAKCLSPNLGSYNDSAFDSIDYAIAQAKQHNIRLIIPLTDQWRYYHGGKWTFVHWAAQAGVAGVVDTKSDLSKNAGNDYSDGGEKGIEQQFYTNPVIVGYYKNYISHILNHIGPNGVALKDDPTILAWETGNEIFDVPTTWTETIASYIKTDLHAKQLVSDGSAASGLHVPTAALDNPSVDIVGGHFYAYPSGLDTAWLGQDAAAAKTKGKVYIAGEWGWSMTGRAAWLQAIQDNTAIAGDMIWSIIPYQADGSAVPHATLSYGSDDVPLYVPALNQNQTMQSGITDLTRHSQAMKVK